MIKLESFFADPSIDQAARDAAEATDRAYRSGLADGRAAQANAEAAALTEAMRNLAAELAGEDSRRAALRHEAVLTLAPILTAILDAMAPTGTSERLERSLVEELSRLAQMAPPMTCRVACAAEMRPVVERCAEAAGLTALEIVERPLGDVLHLSLHGGHIEFSQGAVAEAIRELIREIQED